MEVSPSSASVVQGGTKQLTAAVTVVGGAAQTVTWSSSDAGGKVTVNGSGLVSVAADAAPGDYTITATSTVDGSKADTATITVTAATAAPSITTQPSSETVIEGDDVSFSVVAAGDSPLSYQWKKDGVDIEGATTATLSLTDVQASDAGSYTVEVTNGAGSITSNAAVLTVNAPGDFTLTAEAGDRHVELSWDPVENAMSYKIYTDDSYTATVTDYVYDVIGLNNGIEYSFEVKALDSSEVVIAISNEVTATPNDPVPQVTVPGAPTNVSAIAGNRQATISFRAPADTGGSEITGYIVTSSPGTITTTGTGTIITVTRLTNGTTYTFTVKAVNAAGNSAVSTESNAVTPYRPSSDGGSNDDSDDNGSSTNNNSAPKEQSTVIVIVNGEEQSAGKETQTTEDGKSTITVEVNNKVIESKIDEAIKKNTTGLDNVIQVPVTDTKYEVVKVELTGDIVKKLEENTFDLSIKRDNVEYIIPAEEFTISKVAENFGLHEKDLEDIKVEVQITKLDRTIVEKYNEVVNANGAELVFPPVAFEIVAKTTRSDGTTDEVEISKFSNYVERVMEIPAGVDPSKITTGIVFNPDGTYSHVPTVVWQKDGKWFAKVKSLTNSDYSVIWNPVTVASVENHWAKDAVNDMASRLVIFNSEKFEPNEAITRADFAEYIVRALGLYREGSTHENKYKDIGATGERTLAVRIANEYGIVTGYTDGSFRPDALITREEAMSMYQRAMKITKLVGTDENRFQNYTDYKQVGSWAAAYVKEVLSAHVFNGTTATTISPKSNLTYAEAAQAIKNLLVESKLINK